MTVWELPDKEFLEALALFLRPKADAYHGTDVVTRGGHHMNRCACGNEKKRISAQCAACARRRGKQCPSR